MKKEVYHIFYKNNKLNYIFTVSMLVLASALMIAVAFILQMLLDIATNGTIHDLIRMIVICFIYVTLYVFVLWGKRVFTGRFMKKAMEQYRTYMFGKILDKNINAFNEESQSVYISAMTNDIKTIEINYLLGGLNLILQIVLLIGGVMAMAYYNVWIMLSVLLLCSLQILTSYLFGGKMVECEKRVSNSNSQFVALVKDLLTGFPIIKSFKAEKKTLYMFNKMNEQVESASKHRRDTAGNIHIINQVCSEIVNVAVFGIGAYFAITGRITTGVVVAFIQLLNYVVGPISAIGPVVMERKGAIALIEKMSDLIKEKETQKVYSNLCGFNYSIEFKNVSFKYQGAVENTLKGVNLKFEKNKKYAIVGGSGSGKSTLINLLLGYHKDYEGNIYMDDLEMRTLSLETVYDLISVIQQNVFIFDSTIKDNITLFDEFNDAELMQAIVASGLSELVDKKGFDYSCGENGCNLSGGEKQRISIARCLLRNSPIILMDEATSALDLNTAMLVENKMLNINDITQITVTHKLDAEVLKQYDSIVAMNNGSLIEQGTFDELMSKKEYFYSLYMINK